MSDTRGDAARAVSLVPAEGPADYEVDDRIEEVNLPFRLGGGSTCPTRVSDEELFPTPVDGCWRFTAPSVTPLCTADVYVRTPENRVVATATADGSARVPSGPHVLELSTAPVKTYLALDGPALVSYGDRYPTVTSDGGPATVTLGARSRHGTPAGTVTVTDDPADVAAGLSTFGSALATTSPERSFPTLRGHPPLLRVGEEFELPPLVERAENGVKLGLPFEYGPLFSAAPVAYYLGANVVESERPYLSAGGTRHRLPDEREELALELGRLLAHTFTLDCATRACPAGLYDVDLHLHESLTDRLDPPWEEWYEADLAERTAAYLEVPRSATEGAVDWPQTTDVKPVAANAAILPFLAGDLSKVRSPPPTPTVPDRDDAGPLAEFVRNDRAAPVTRSADDASPRPDSTRSPTQNVTAEGDAIVSPRPAGSTSLAWVGPGFPMRAAKPTVDAYRRRLDRTLSADLTIDVTVVCNDGRMAGEADDVYGFRDHVAFDVVQAVDLSVAELAELLRDDHDFLHYIGHVDERGVECSDSFLDLRRLDGTGVEAFLLNACTSYQQGMALVEAGALGGVVSLTELPNSLATRVGRDLARLFDAGFPLDAALDVVARGPFAGSAYTIVGDPRVQLCQCATGAPIVAEITDTEPDAFHIRPVYYPTRSFGLGTMANPHYEASNRQYVASGVRANSRSELDTFRSFLELARIPLAIENEIHWTDEMSVSDVRSLTDQQ
ncbi:caspase family protein [Halorarum salinum]|uniref:Caspase family protein n=1 Tax=Halorarum salinum TaxID=2743089 RepID=A0A7D5QBH6_9EURY|nr:caspase family protein [Halobaculum salinum]QLG62239.1 caspase family protein [Halobaculum salinum]